MRPFTCLSSAAALVLALASPALGQSRTEHDGEHRFVLTGVGRFAVFADMVSLERDGDGAKIRAFQVAEADFHVGDQAYWGGWSWWRFDCAARTADRLDFAAVKAGGAEVPATPDASPAYDAAPGGDAAELLNAACDPHPPAKATRTVWRKRCGLGEGCWANNALLPLGEKVARGARRMRGRPAAS